MNRIQKRAKEIGVSQSEIARRANVDPSNLSDIARDKRDPRLSTIRRICTAAGCESIDELFPLNDAAA